VNPSDWQHGGTHFDWQGYRLFVRRGGAGKPLLLIHGFPTSSFDWVAMWPVLSAGYSLHALDMLGFGLSEKRERFPTVFQPRRINGKTMYFRKVCAKWT